MAPLLSIIIVAYKSSAEIGPCVASLPREIQGQKVEVLVVDNAREEATRAAVANFPWVNYLAPSANLGFGKANNLGFGASTGDLVLFLNPDTICNEKALAHCCSRAQAENDLGLISPRLELPDGSMDLASRRGIPTLWDGFCRASGLAAALPNSRWAAGYNLTYLDPQETYDVGAINGAFMLGRRSLLASLAAVPGTNQIFDEAFFMYGDDLDLCIRVGQAGWRVVYDGRVAITHLKGVSVAKEYTAMSTAIFDANRDIFIKHFGTSPWRRRKYIAAFGAWKQWARWRARAGTHSRVQPR